MILEVCVENVDSAFNAYEGGARRLEVCSALDLGGLTPSLGLVLYLKKFMPSDCKIFVMIRTRPGNFIYNENEQKVMAEDIKMFKEHKADGFVFGCLNHDRSIDKKACKRLLKMADGIPCTFHRAFDRTRNPEQAVEVLVDLGFSRVLTSGQKDTALLGKDFIRRLNYKVNELGSDLIIMPGGGIRPDNIKEIMNTTQCTEFHSSAREDTNDPEKSLCVTKTSIVLQIVELMKDI